MKRTVLLALALSAAGGAALAQEAMSTRPADGPSPQASAAPVARLDAPTDNQAQAADWARRVLARANGQLPPTDERAEGYGDPVEAQRRGGCVRNPDRSPHGEMEVAVGTGGYRSASGVVTQPIGDCGQITIGIGTSRGGRGYYGDYGGGYGRGWR